jgi:hypothetical protein
MASDSSARICPTTRFGILDCLWQQILCRNLSQKRAADSTGWVCVVDNFGMQN